MLEEHFGVAEIIFVTGGLGPTTDDITREITAEMLGLELAPDAGLEELITARLEKRGIRLTDRILRQAMVPAGAQVLPNENGTAPGLYLAARETANGRSPHLFLLPGPPRELQPMFRKFVLPILQTIVRPDRPVRLPRLPNRRNGRVVRRGSGRRGAARVAGARARLLRAHGRSRSAGDCSAEVLEQADAIIRGKLAVSIFSTSSESLESVIVRQLSAAQATLAVAESCTGGFLAHRLTNVPGASAVFLAGFVTYANEAKSRHARGRRRADRGARRSERGGRARDGRRGAGKSR